jgi:hypothetical protein
MGTGLVSPPFQVHIQSLLARHDFVAIITLVIFFMFFHVLPDLLPIAELFIAKLTSHRFPLKPMSLVQPPNISVEISAEI